MFPYTCLQEVPRDTKDRKRLVREKCFHNREAEVKGIKPNTEDRPPPKAGPTVHRQQSSSNRRKPTRPATKIQNRSRIQQNDMPTKPGLFETQIVIHEEKETKNPTEDLVKCAIAESRKLRRDSETYLSQFLQYNFIDSTLLEVNSRAIDYVCNNLLVDISDLSVRHCVACVA